jgi:hypothetical protein
VSFVCRYHARVEAELVLLVSSASDLPPHLHIIVPDLSLLREYLAAHPDEINKLDDYVKASLARSIVCLAD